MTIVGGQDDQAMSQRSTVHLPFSLEHDASGLLLQRLVPLFLNGRKPHAWGAKDRKCQVLAAARIRVKLAARPGVMS